MAPMTSLSVFSLILSLTFAAPLATILLERGLNPSCAPGGNFDLSVWSLQLPTGSTGSPTTISAAALEGCAGYQDNNIFFTESGDGALVMKVCGSTSSCGCVTTANSQHCRTELRESNPSSWSPNSGTNSLSVTLSVPVPDNSGSGTVIGQIHMDDSVSTKPVAELYYSSSGVLKLGVEQTRSGGNEILTTIPGTIAPGSKFSYQITYQKNVLQVSINGGAPQTFSTYSLDAPSSYFKVGNYNQGSDASDVHVFSISTSH